MTQLLRLIDETRRRGVVVAMPTLDGKIRARFEPLSKKEWELFQQVQPFVFSPDVPLDAGVPEEERENAIKNWRPGLDESSELDAPFPVFSIEYLTGPMDVFINADGNQKTMCILIIEVEPKVYGYYSMSEDDHGRIAVWKSNAEGKTVRHVLNRLEREQIGTENVRHIVKMGAGKQHKMHRIRKLIHVWPKKLVKSFNDAKTQINIDWSHRWEVRGHWRKHEGLGKDRAGNYCINGFTWVVHHEKGPDHLPLIKKTRIVED